MALGFSREEERRLLELSFEAHGEEYHYYRNRWSRGVPVTASEREDYLAGGPSRRAFHAAVAARAAVAPPRRFGPVYWEMLGRMPWFMGAAALIFGLLMSLAWFSDAALASRVLQLFFGLGLIVFGAQFLWARLKARSRR
jgi:hypothetical protein